LNQIETINAFNNEGNLAFSRGWLEKARSAYESAIGLLRPDNDDIASMLYENLGLTYMAQARYEPACRSFFRALDGDLTCRPQSARYLVGCLIKKKRYNLASRQLEAYEGVFGKHPDGWTLAWIEATSERRKYPRKDDKK